MMPVGKNKRCGLRVFSGYTSAVPCCAVSLSISPAVPVTGPFGGMGHLELVGPYMKSQWAPREAGPLNQEQTDLFEDHGPPGARWGSGSKVNGPLKQVGALRTPGAGGGSEINSKIACLRTMGAPRARCGAR